MSNASAIGRGQRRRIVRKSFVARYDRMIHGPLNRFAHLFAGQRFIGRRITLNDAADYGMRFLATHAKPFADFHSVFPLYVLISRACAAR